MISKAQLSNLVSLEDATIRDSPTPGSVAVASQTYELASLYESQTKKDGHLSQIDMYIYIIIYIYIYVYMIYPVNKKILVFVDFLLGSSLLVFIL